jgi:biopolymer transport protein ExbB/TolQ
MAMSTNFNNYPAILPQRNSFWSAWGSPWLVILSIFQIAGCSTANPPTESIMRAETALRTAVEARADESAPADLRRARDNIEASKKAAASGKHEEARRLAEAAQVEAELAEAKADAEIMRWAADRLRRSIDALRQEMELGARGGSRGVPGKE